jgi:MraZ protein
MGECGRLWKIIHNFATLIRQITEMTGFFGTHNAKFDDKGRVVIPSAIKSVVPADQMRFVVRKDRNSRCLEMFTWQEWEAMSQAVRSKLDLAFNARDIQYWRTFMNNTIPVTPDAKLGRITIPEEIRKAAGITKDVVFLGVDYKVEIWAKELFEDGCLSDEEFDQMSKEIAGRA